MKLLSITTACWLLVRSVDSLAQPVPHLGVTSGRHQVMPQGTFSPDNKYIITDDCFTGKLWDVSTGKFIRQFNAAEETELGGRIMGPWYRFEYLPNGKVCEWRTDEVRIHDISIPDQFKTIKLPEESIESYWQQGELFAIVWENGMSIRNLSQGKTVRKLKFPKPEQPSIFNEQKTLLVDGNGKVFDIAKGTSSTSLAGFSDRLTGSANFRLTKSGELFIMGITEPNEFDGRLYFWDCRTGKLLDSLDGKNYRPTFSTDEKLLLTIGGRPDLWGDQLDFDAMRAVTSYNTPGYLNEQETYAWEHTAKIWDVRTRKLVRTLEGHTATLTSAKFSPDGAYVVTASADSTARVYNATTGKEMFILRGHEGVVTICGFDNSGKYIITTSWDRTCKVWNVATGKLIASLKPFSFPTEKVVADKKGDRFLAVNKTKYPLRPMGGCDDCTKRDGVLWESRSGRSLQPVRFEETPLPYFSPDGKVLLGGIPDQGDGALEIGPGSPRWIIEKQPAFSRIGDIGYLISADSLNAWDPSGERKLIGIPILRGSTALVNDTGTHALAVDPSGELGLWSITTHAKVLPIGPGSSVKRFEFSENGNRFMVITSDLHAKVWDIDTKKLVADWIVSESDGKDLTLSPAGLYFLLVGHEEQRFLDLSGKLIYRLEAPPASNLFTSKDDSYLLVDQQGKKVMVFDLATRTVTRSLEIEGKSDRLFLVSKDILFITDRSTGVSRLWKTKTGELVDPLFRINSGISSIDFSGDRTTMFVTAMDGSITIFKGASFDQKLITLYPLGESDWVVSHPSGLFDASPGAMDKLYFIQGVEVIQFDQLKDRYYEPGLWKKVTSGEALRSVVGFKSIDLPPDIQPGTMDDKGYLPVTLTNRGGGIGEVNVFVNGKEIIRDARTKDTDPNASTLSLMIFIGQDRSILKGQENFIGIKAWNKDHWVVSRGQLVSYQSKESERYEPGIHILVCGISDYTGNEIDLKYAAKDASDMSLALQLGAKQLFGVERSTIYTLTTSGPPDNYPTRANIIKTIGKIASAAHPLDVFVMYLSGHGINYGGQDGDWHYLTQDAYTASASAYNDPAIRAQTTISSNELVELFKKVSALKQVLLIDACASGKVVDNLMAQKDIESSTLRALDRMRDRTGMHIITGCAADAVSYEASKYGQGVLTYSLLEGIRGAALREDQYVDVNKLFQYAQERVPALAQGVGGIQSPQVFSPQESQSFDIGLLTEATKKEIPIAKIRPVYVRSNFQDENELEDVLGLSKLVDESLNEVSSRGVASSLIFVDVREYPDGCKLTGSYKKEGGTITLKLRKRCGAEATTVELRGKSVAELRKAILAGI